MFIQYQQFTYYQQPTYHLAHLFSHTTYVNFNVLMVFTTAKFTEKHEQQEFPSIFDTKNTFFRIEYAPFLKDTEGQSCYDTFQ